MTAPQTAGLPALSCKDSPLLIGYSMCAAAEGYCLRQCPQEWKSPASPCNSIIPSNAFPSTTIPAGQSNPDTGAGRTPLHDLAVDRDSVTADSFTPRHGLRVGTHAGRGSSSCAGGLTADRSRLSGDCLRSRHDLSESRGGSRGRTTDRKRSYVNAGLDHARFGKLSNQPLRCVRS